VSKHNVAGWLVLNYIPPGVSNLAYRLRSDLLSDGDAPWTHQKINTSGPPTFVRRC
jgi:hypothetical protein